uniref:Uncharacterized protein n=1 Tax=Oryza barthii TaxID=65489 RepID=A0A0D3GK61_9ORYZ
MASLPPARPHALVIPFPAQGHVIPLMEVGEAEEKLAAAGASIGCLPVDGRVVAANEKVRRRRRVVVGVADAGCGLHGTAAASRRRGAALLLSRLTR